MPTIQTCGSSSAQKSITTRASLGTNRQAEQIYLFNLLTTGFFQSAIPPDTSIRCTFTHLFSSERSAAIIGPTSSGNNPGPDEGAFVMEFNDLTVQPPA